MGALTQQSKGEQAMLNVERIRRCIIEPLRSGRYAQGTEMLEQIDENGNVKNCCLGVATREAMNAGVNITAEIRSVGDTTRFIDPEWDEDTANFGETLLPAVRRFYGFDTDDDDPYLPTDDGQRTATALNDVAQWPFAAIADAFERLITEEQLMREDS